MSDVRVLIVPLVGWLLAQTIKYALQLRKDGFQIRDLYTSGGFPSSHTTSTVALACYIGATDGWTSHIFALAAIFAAIVMYDSFGVRRAVGQHSKILQELVQKEKVGVRQANGRTSRGHTPMEVLGGFMLGIAIGLAFGIF